MVESVKRRLRLSKIIFPVKYMAGHHAMYFRLSKGAQLRQDRLYLPPGSAFSCSTYFNSLSIGKWRKYTYLEEVRLAVSICGQFKIRLCQMKLAGEHAVHKILAEQEVSAQACREFIFTFPKAADGLLYFELMGVKAGGIFAGAEYFTEIEESRVRHVRLAAGICTYKREAYVLKNIELLLHNLQQEECVLKDKLEIFIADNAGTLSSGTGSRDRLFTENEQLHLYTNRNCGGAGGFARCMMEAIKRRGQAGFTHMILMDDDVVIEWGCLEKTYAVLSILREEYQDAFIGGAMLRMDRKNIQAESGALWNGGSILSLKAGYDLEQETDCIRNETEEKNGMHAEYNAWWYCCFPMETVTKRGLPLPLFIHHDDVEWGLRNMRRLIRMNGICIWHEPSESRYTAELTYYNIRNLLICNAVHPRQGCKRQSLSVIWREFFRNSFLYRYRHVEAEIKGIEDFMKGTAFLKKTDAQKLHQKLCRMRYKAGNMRDMKELSAGNMRDIKELSAGNMRDIKRLAAGKITRSGAGRAGIFEKLCRSMLLNGLFLPSRKICYVPAENVSSFAAWRSRQAVFIDEKNGSCLRLERNRRLFLKCFLRMCRVTVRLMKNYGKIGESYRKKIHAVQTNSFWEMYLELYPEKNGV